MDLDDLPGEYEIGAAVAGLAALALSPRMRKFVRRGAVAGLTKLLAIGGAVGGWTSHRENGRRQGEAMDAEFMRELAREAHVELANRKPRQGS